MVRDSSLIALERLSERTKESDKDRVLNILLEIGPTHDRRILEALNQAEQKTLKKHRRVWEINSVTGRRNDLVANDLVEDMGLHSGRWHDREKSYHIWRVRGDDKPAPPGWRKVESAPQAHRSYAERKANIRRIREEAEARVMKRIKEHRQVRRQKQTIPTGQLLMAFSGKEPNGAFV